jgi:hypothetical protein
VVQKLIDPDDAAADPAPAQLPAATVDITNTTVHDGLATKLAGDLVERGLTRGVLRTEHPTKAHTSLTYNPDVADVAEALADQLEYSTLTPRPDPNLPVNHLKLVLGTDFTTHESMSSAPTDQHTPSGTPAAPAAGVPTTSLHTEGVPCVK